MQTQTITREQLVRLVLKVPPDKLTSVYDFVRFVIQPATVPIQASDSTPDEALSALLSRINWDEVLTNDLTQASASALDDWFSPEEDAAWQHLANMVVAK